MFLIPNPGLQMTQIPDPEKVLETLKYWQYQESISFVTPTPPPTVVLCLVRPRSSLNSSQTLQRGVSRGEVQLTESFPNHILISNLMKLLQNIQSVSALFRNVNPEISRKGQEASLEKTLPRKVSKEYEKSLLRKRQGLLHLFFFATNSRQQRQLYNKLSQDAVFINRTLSQRFFFTSLLQPPLKDKFTLH